MAVGQAHSRLMSLGMPSDAKYYATTGISLLCHLPFLAFWFSPGFGMLISMQGDYNHVPCWVSMCSAGSPFAPKQLRAMTKLHLQGWGSQMEAKPVAANGISTMSAGRLKQR